MPMVVGRTVRNKPGQPKKMPMPRGLDSEEDINSWYMAIKMLIDNSTETQILVITVLFCLDVVNNNAITPAPMTNKLLPLPPTTPAASNPSNK